MAIEMRRNDSEEWPDDAPVGTYAIELGIVGSYPRADGFLQFVCPGGKRCSVLIGKANVPRPQPDALPIWGWNGDVDRPTLTPSINCERSCGWHGHIQNGQLL